MLACIILHNMVIEDEKDLEECHTRFQKANQMRTMYVPGSELMYTAIT
jgi:hypothetical protein